jgi:hypothetical protein
MVVYHKVYLNIFRYDRILLDMIKYMIIILIYLICMGIFFASQTIYSYIYNLPTGLNNTIIHFTNSFSFML